MLSASYHSNLKLSKYNHIMKEKTAKKVSTGLLLNESNSEMWMRISLSEQDEVKYVT